MAAILKTTRAISPFRACRRRPTERSVSSLQFPESWASLRTGMGSACSSASLTKTVAARASHLHVEPLAVSPVCPRRSRSTCTIPGQLSPGCSTSQALKLRRLGRAFRGRLIQLALRKPRDSAQLGS